MTSTAPLLVVRGLSKRYGAVQALRGVSFEVEPASIFGFIGPNGAGKTTAIRIMAGLARPSAGGIWLGGHDLIRNRTEAARGLRTLVEVPAFYLALSGAENLHLFARLAGAPASDVPRLLEAVGLSHAARRAVGGYSLGMRQRLGIAQALVGSPRVVVLDEPMNGLDPAAIQLVRELMFRERNERGVSFVLSSHLLYDVETLCDRVVILHRGEIVAGGPIGELLSGASSGYRLTTTNDKSAFSTLVSSMGASNPRRDPSGAICVAGDAEILPVLHHTLVQAGCPVVTIEPIRETLEGYFIEKTEGEMG